MQVRDPSGRNWVIKRQLVRLPRWGGFGRPRLDVTDGAIAGSGGGGLGDLVFGVVVVVSIVLTIAFVWPVIVLLVELVLALLLVGVRFLLGRWTVVAETVGERNAWRVRGRARSATFAAEVAAALRSGAALPRGSSFEAKASVRAAEDELAKPASSGHVRVLKP